MLRERLPTPCLGGSGLLEPNEWIAIQRALALSRRELDVIQVGFQNDSVLHIAERLRLSPHTVHAYRDRIFRKLGVQSFAGVIVAVFTAYVISFRSEQNNQHSSPFKPNRGDRVSVNISASEANSPTMRRESILEG